jgi:tetratricopeptide (TPR) repeat protein
MSNQLVQEFLSQRRLEEAKEQIDLLVSREPEKADNFYYLGIYHYFKNNLPSAIQNLKRCLELDSKHTDAAICLSVLLNDVGNYQEGKKIFDKAKQENRIVLSIKEVMANR